MMMTTTRRIDVGAGVAEGVEMALPGAPLVVAAGPNGFVMCGYLDLATAERLGAAAAVVRGVRTVLDLLEAPVAGCTTAAQARGVTEGMSGRAALERFF